MDGAKIYGLCLERLKFQIIKADKRGEASETGCDGEILLECYNTGDIEDLIDILELYDIDERTQDGLFEKLDDLAYTVSVLLRRQLRFDYNRDGDLGIYLTLKNSPVPDNEMPQEYAVAR